MRYMVEEKGVFFVPHTRWDTEWYRSGEVFKLNFTLLMEELISQIQDNTLKFFTLDGQTYILREFIKEQEKEEVKNLVEDGMLKIGPLLHQIDLFLSWGEVITRNLIKGIADGEKMGKVMKSLYLPESCIPSQTPQIMKNFDIPHLIFIRGLGEENISSEYILEGADGTRVFATYLIDAYNNIGFLPEDIEEAMNRVKVAIDKILPYTLSHWVLLNHGGDHHIPQRILKRVSEELEKKGFKVKFGSYEEYFNTIKETLSKAPLLKGEIFSSKHYPALYGRHSSRMDIKIKTRKILQFLTNFVEPFSVMQYVYGGRYPEKALSRIWDIILDIHQHNVIGGTVSDGVYEKAIAKLYDASDLIKYIGEEIYFPHNGEDVSDRIVVMNTSLYERGGYALFYYTTRGEKKFKVVDEEGREIPFAIVEKRKTEGHFPFSSHSPVYHWEVLVKSEKVSAMGFTTYKIEESQETKEANYLSNSISNEYFHITTNKDGSITLEDLRTGYTFVDFHYFVDEADRGDLYDFSPLEGDKPTRLIPENLKVYAYSWDIKKSLIISGDLSIPKSLTQDRKARSTEEVKCPFSLNISLYQGVPYIDCTLVLENKALDHRLTLCFPISSADEVLAGSPFHLTKRKITKPEGKGWIEKPSNFSPFEKILLVKGKDVSLAFFSPVIGEYGIDSNNNSTEIYLTLLRSVGWLSRKDSNVRPIEVAPKIKTPKAQCITSLRYRYAIMPFKNEIEYVIKQYQNFINPLRATIYKMGKPLVREGLISLQPESLIFSACKKERKGRGIVVRFYNPLSHSVKARLNSGKFSQWCFSNMKEEVTSFEDLPFERDIKPFEIATLILR